VRKLVPRQKQPQQQTGSKIRIEAEIFSSHPSSNELMDYRFDLTAAYRYRQAIARIPLIPSFARKKGRV
jgi:hypothetical protein